MAVQEAEARASTANQRLRVRPRNMVMDESTAECGKWMCL